MNDKTVNQVDLKNLKQSYLFYGNEDYLKKSYIQLIRNELFPDGNDYFDFESFTADNYTPSSLSNAIQSSPFMSDKRLIVLRDMRFETFLKDDTEDFFSALETLSQCPYCILIVVLSAAEDLSDSKKELFSELQKHLTPIQFVHETPARLAKWVAKHFKENGVFAEQSVCLHLIDVCGCDMFTLKNETDKISAYVKSKGREILEIKDIDDSASISSEIETFEFANSILNKNKKRAFEILKIYKDKKIPPELILSNVTRTICTIYNIKVIINEGFDGLNVIKSKADIKNDYVARLHYGAAKYGDENRLKELITICKNMDYKIKSSGINNYTLLEELTAEALLR